MHFCIVVEINLYKPKAVNITIQWATEWNELTTKEVQFIAVCLFADSFSKNELFLFLLKNRIKDQTNLSEKEVDHILSLMDKEQMAIEMDSLINFIIEINTLTKNPFSTIDKLIGPADDFENLICGDYEDAEGHFLNFIQDNKNNTHLHKLAAVLWRENNKIDFVQSEIFFSNQNESVILAIYLWYVGCRNMLPKYFPLVFDGNNENEESKTLDLTAIDMLSFTKMVHYGAGVKNGTREHIRNMLLKEFLFDCQLEAENSPDIIK